MSRCSRNSLIAAGCAAILLVTAGCGGNSANDTAAEGPAEIVAPVTLPGPYAVGCSNVTQDFGRIAAGVDAEDYWESVRDANGTPRQVGDLLTEPVDALSVTVTAPNNSELFGSFAGQSLQFVVLACYPTAANNPRSDFALPTGDVVPHMQSGAQPPLFADTTVRHPLVAFSHGLRGSPLSADYLKVLTWLASHGYVVAAPFHGDPRFADLTVDDFDDAISLLANLQDAVAMQALRPLAMSATLDLLLAHPQWRDHLDASQIGGFGASLGGQTMLLMAGAALTTSPGLSSRPIGTDARLRAAVGYVPYFGVPLLPTFGRDQEGLDAMAMPYLGIAGTADRTAPLALTQQGVERLAGQRALVTLAGVGHELEPTSTADMLTWTLTFLDALVRNDEAAQARLATMGSVAGGADDRVIIPFRP